MVRRCIGIDIGSSCLCAVQLSRMDGQFYIEKVFSVQIRRSTDSIPETLRTLINQHGFHRDADIAVSLPHDAVFFRNLETDSDGAEQIQLLSGSALEHNFPLQQGEIVAQIRPHRRLPNEKFSVLMAALKRESLHERLNTLAEAKMHPSRIGAVIFAVHSTAIINHPEIMTGRVITAYINESYLTLAITQDNDILIVRSIPIVSRSNDDSPLTREQLAEALSSEAEITWRKVFGEGIGKDTKIYLATGGNVTDDLKIMVEANLHCQINIVNPYAKVKCSGQYNSDAKISVAEGLALGLLVPEKTTGINFLEAENNNIKPQLNLKKELVICAMLLAAIVIVLLGGLFIRLSRLETMHTEVKDEISEIFRRTLPEETEVVNPLAQLTQKLQLLQKNYALFSPASIAGLDPLEILHAVTTSIPPETNISIDSMLITPESVRLVGISRSFESVYNWQQLLEKIQVFSNIDVQNVKKENESQQVHFTVLISLAAMETQ